MRQLIEKAEVLIEALPYIRAFEGKTVVIKYGGRRCWIPGCASSRPRI